MDNNNQDHTHDDCPYCQDLAAKEAGTIAPHSHDDCPYCARLAHQAEDGHNAADCPYCQSYEERHAGHNADDCQYCQTMDQRQSAVQPEAGPSVNNPTTQDSENFIGQDLNTPGLPKPDPQSEPPVGLGTSMEAPITNNNFAISQPAQGVPNETPSTQEAVQLDHSKEALQAIAQEIESDGNATPTQSDAQVAQSVDDTALAVGTQMDGNTSRPAGFSQNTPQDMGIAEDPKSSDAPGSPDLTSVLHEGLDSNADNIQRERVVQMVSTALAGFKSSKDILERAQSQAPQLYQSSIQMLKAMIEMARMLGFGQGEIPANDANPLAQNEWADPFALHPDHGGQGHAGHAPSGNAGPAAMSGSAGAVSGGMPPGTPQGQEGTVGKPIGKLPTSATTEHVARTPLLPGAVNTQGQKKVIDPDTGKTRWIDMKEGRVQGPTGIPVKPPTQGQNGNKV